ncbi:hypothetical protein V6N13_035140 [Hibiscus sabdariffa]|uniref:Uncharacterized protein n=1 Tax=Hibiscus sabdariffa TaxID=183260 RepID=A0ABR2NHJ6_9ROSI
MDKELAKAFSMEPIMKINDGKAWIGAGNGLGVFEAYRWKEDATSLETLAYSVREDMAFSSVSFKGEGLMNRQRMTVGWKLAKALYRWFGLGESLYGISLLPNYDANAVLVTKACVIDGKKATAGGMDEVILVPRVRRSLTNGFNMLS